MKKYLIPFLFANALFMVDLFAQEVTPSTELVKIKIKTSKTLGLYEFTRGLTGTYPTSQTLMESFQKSRYANKEAGSVLEKLRAVKFDYRYQITEQVKLRNNHRSVEDRLVMAAANSKDLQQFKTKTVGILPNQDHRVLFSTLTYFEPIYDSIIWKPSQSYLRKNLKDLKQRATQLNIEEYFEQALNFYHAEWDRTIPFEIVVSPIPSKRGHAMATPKGNILSMLFIEGMDVDTQLSIAFHELSHILFENQPLDFQRELEHGFLELKSPYKIHAYQLVDEALATAVGNGWFYKMIFGKIDPEDWYSSPYINQQAKSIFPLVEKYIENGKPIDILFVDKYVEQYGDNFPNSHLKVDNILANTEILCAEAYCSQDMIASVFFEKLKFLRSFNTLSPLNSKDKQKELTQSVNTQLVLIKEIGQLELLVSILPWLKEIEKPVTDKFILTHLNDNGVMQIVILMENKSDLGPAVTALRDREILSKDTGLIQYFE